jgi:formamidopyrimidine-DNA glycosylase
MIELPESFNLAKQIFGEPGGYQVVMCARNKEKPCPNCGSLIQQESYMGGSIYTCSTCQPSE